MAMVFCTTLYVCATDLTSQIFTVELARHAAAYSL